MREEDLLEILRERWDARYDEAPEFDEDAAFEAEREARYGID